jgi:hypothetical protein
MWQFYFSIRGRAANWTVSIIFTLVGAVIDFFGPGIVQPSPDRGSIVLILQILGGVFLGLGLSIFLWMVVDLYLKYRNPEFRDQWYWWGSFIAPMLAAGLFAVPATLAFPVILLVYLLGPGNLLPVDPKDVTSNLLIGLLFTVVGLLTLGLMYLITKSTLKGRPTFQVNKIWSKSFRH